MRSVAVFEAKNRFSELVNAVAKEPIKADPHRPQWTPKASEIVSRAFTAPRHRNE